MKYDFKKLKDARETALLTQTELAEKTGLSVTTVNQVELGKAPWLKAIRRIAGFLKVDNVILQTPKTTKRRTSRRQRSVA